MVLVPLTIVGLTRELWWCWWPVPRWSGGPWCTCPCYQLFMVTFCLSQMNLAFSQRCTTPAIGQGSNAVRLEWLIPRPHGVGLCKKKGGWTARVAANTTPTASWAAAGRSEARRWTWAADFEFWRALFARHSSGTRRNHSLRGVFEWGDGRTRLGRAPQPEEGTWNRSMGPCATQSNNAFRISGENANSKKKMAGQRWTEHPVTWSRDVILSHWQKLVEECENGC